MDSGNSSSMQSSSGGCGGDQEEYDSRADQSISAFFNHNNTTTVSSNITGPTHLDSLIANYFNTGWSTDHPLWSTNPTDGSCPRPPPLPQPTISSQPIFLTNPLQESPRLVSNTNTTSPPPMCSVSADKRNGLATTRNPKKRSRVSRRAPTTVLTTDTSNFRAMVQEFTGNPSTPFTGLSSSSSPFSRSRFDLFGSSSSSSASRPLKPFPHKLISQPTPSHHHHHHYLFTPPPPPPTSSSDYQQSLLLNMNTQNITNPFLNNQTPNNPLTDQSLLCDKSKHLMFDQSLTLRTSDGFGHVDVGTNFEGLHNIVSSSTSSALKHPTLSTTMRGDQARDDDNDVLRSINGEEDQPMVQKSNASEGMVELSWISSSD